MDLYNKAMGAASAIEGAAASAGAAGVRAAGEVGNAVAGMSVELLNTMNSTEALDWAMRNMSNNAIMGIRDVIDEASALRQILDELAIQEKINSLGKDWDNTPNLDDYENWYEKEHGYGIDDEQEKHKNEPGYNNPGHILNPKLKIFHDGGFVDSSPSSGWEKSFYTDVLKGVKSDEILAKLRKNELVLNNSQQKSLLDVVSSAVSSATPIPSEQEYNLSFGTLMNIEVQGNLDQSVLPDIKKIANKVMGELNKNIVQNRGIRKNAKAQAI